MPMNFTDRVGKGWLFVTGPSTKKVAVSRTYLARGETALRADAETGGRHRLNILLWVLQVLAALMYGASGVMKVFMFDKISKDVPSFGALPREAWMALGILELVCTVGLIVPAAFHWQPALTVVAATVLAIESLVFIGVHVKYRETTTIIMCAVLGLLMAFIAFGRMVLKPIV
jgi:DoxX-like family